MPLENRALLKSTMPPENRASLKSPPSKTTPVKSKFRPCQDVAASSWRCAVITRMTVWRTSRMVWKDSRCASGASCPGLGSMACANRRIAHRRRSAGFLASHQPVPPWRIPQLVGQLACHCPAAQLPWRSVRSGSGCAAPRASFPTDCPAPSTSHSSCSRCSAKVLLNCSRCSASAFSACLLVPRRPNTCAAMVPITVRAPAMIAATTWGSTGRT